MRYIGEMVARGSGAGARLTLCLLIGCGSSAGRHPDTDGGVGAADDGSADDGGAGETGDAGSSTSSSGSAGVSAAAGSASAGSSGAGGASPTAGSQSTPSPDAGRTQPSLRDCSALCAVAQSACGDDEGSCLAECQELERNAACGAEFDALLECQLEAGGRCDTDGAYEVVGCDDQGLSYFECYADNPLDDDGDGLSNLEDPCPRGETVTDLLLPGCECAEGYRADDQVDDQAASCLEIDECAEDTDGCAQRCENTPGGYLCSCDPGHALDADGHGCHEVDDCEPGGLGDVACRVAEGGACLDGATAWSCLSCPAGYALSGDETSCDDVDECADDNGGCAQGCENLVGTFACRCPDGYALDADGVSCDDVDECAIGGVGRDRCGVGGGGGCANSDGDYACSACPAGQQISPDAHACDDPCSGGRWGANACLETLGGRCSVAGGGFRCSACPAGYHLAPGDARCLPPKGRIAASHFHTCNLRADDNAQCWGRGEDGESTPPVGVELGWITAASFHSCGLRASDGRVICWGRTPDPAPDRAYSVLERGLHHACAIRADSGLVDCWDSSLSSRGQPPEGVAFTDLAVGGLYACAIREDNGEVGCWGSGGPGSTQIRPEPPAGVAFATLATGGHYYCGVRRDDGLVQCWGEDRQGEGSPPEVPMRVVALSEYNGCGLTLDGGEPLCWGATFTGVPGDAPTGTAYTGISVTLLSACALRADGGGVDCWGSNVNEAATPPNDDTFATLTMGLDWGCGIGRDDDLLRCWGNESFVWLDLPTGLVRNVDGDSYYVCGLGRDDGLLQCWGSRESWTSATPFVDLAAGYTYACMLRESDHQVECRGASVTDPRGMPPAGVAFTRIEGGDDFSCGLRESDERPVCWGEGGAGSEPDLVLRDLTVGASHACGIRKDNDEAVCWGSDASGAATPPAGVAFAQISAGHAYTCAVRRDDAAAQCWGSNEANKATPPTGIPFAEVAAGEVNTCAIRADNHRRVCWGERALGP